MGKIQFKNLVEKEKMTVFKLDNQTYSFPETCEDVTIWQVITFYQSIYLTRPKLMIALAEATKEDPINEERVSVIEKKMQSKVWISNQLYPYFCRVVNHFCAVPFEVLKQTTPSHLEYLYQKCINALEMPDVECKKLYLIDGEVYELPDKLMSQSTLQEFAESAQYEENASEIQNGNWEGMLNVCSVILRKQGEEYSDEVYERNRERFRTLPLKTLCEVAFFLRQLSLSFVLDLNLSLMEQTVTELMELD
jgi:hypothetical protein